MFATAIRLMDSHRLILAQQRSELESLTFSIRARLLDYASHGSLDTISDWVRSEASWHGLRVLDTALQNGTMPHSPTHLAGAMRTCEESVVIEYIQISHLLDGASYPVPQVAACLRGMKKSSLCKDWDFTDESDLANAVVMVKFMHALAGTSVVASGTIGVAQVNVILFAELAELALKYPDRIDDVIRFIKERQGSVPDPETESLIAKDPSDINPVLQIIDRKNNATYQVVKEMLESDHGILVEGML